MKETKNSSKLAFIILVAMGIIALFSIREDSVTMDESPHITSGYSYLKFQDMRLNPEHPPLIKNLTAIPLLFQKINFPTEHPAWTSMVNAQWDLGPQFLYRSGNDPDKIIFWGRIGPILLTLLFGWLVFKWARELFGDMWALFTLALFAFSPTILAHGRLVTTDVPAAFAFFATIYYYLKFLKNPSRKNLITAGVVFAIAQLTKFSLVLLLGFLPGITILWLFVKKFSIAPKRVASPSEHDPSTKIRDFSTRERGRASKRGRWTSEESEKIISNLLTWALRFIIILAITALVILPVYQFHVLNYPPARQAADIQHILQNSKFPALTDSLVWMSDKPVLRAYAQYILGVSMVFMRVAGGNTTYFLGEVSNQAWWYYFPVVFLLKVPMALLVLIATSLILFSRRLYRIVIKWHKGEGNGNGNKKLPPFFVNNFDEIAMLLFVLFYWFISITGNLNIGVRHVLPSFPFIYLLITGQLKRWFTASSKTPLNRSKRETRGLTWKLFLESLYSPLIIWRGAGVVKVTFLITMLFWYVFSSLRVYPHFIAHFNELAGGANRGYRYVVDSNLDWGQDLRRLKKFVEEKKIDRIKVDYFGGGDVKYYLGDKAEIWHADNGPAIGWIAVSATFLQTSRAYPWASYKWLDTYEPVEKIGYSIFVYNIFH